MTSFAYTTGNPNNLTAGATASMNDIQGPFTDLRTFLNGANLSDTNVQAAGVSLSKLVPLILYGTIAGGSGAIVNAGSGGWTSARTGAGAYTITFSPAFSTNPIVIAQPSIAAVISHSVPAVTTSTATVSTFNSSTGANIDANFFFFVIGAR